MKHLIFPLLALTLIVACGKDNKSGQKDSWTYSDPYLGPGTAPANLQALFSAVPCSLNPSASRTRMDIPLQGFQTIIPTGDIYVGMTSYGDIAVIQGNGTRVPQFSAYLCHRDFTTPQGSVLSNVRIGSYSNCIYKPITSATLVFPGSVASAEFRMLDFGIPQNGTFVPIPTICK